MKKLSIVVFPFFLMAEVSFINTYEYGQMLYQNPRGIGCHKCHGDNGEGKTLAQYYSEKKKNHILVVAPRINHKSFGEMKVALGQKKSFMPTYFLSDQEIEAIVHYFQAKKSFNR